MNGRCVASTRNATAQVATNFKQDMIANLHFVKESGLKSKAMLESGKTADFGALMQQFLDGLPEGGLVMCHPGVVDETLVDLDPLTGQREHEYAFLGSEEFAQLLITNKVTLG